MQSRAHQVRTWNLPHTSVRTPLCLICCLALSQFCFASYDAVSDVLFDYTTYIPILSIFGLIDLQGWSSLDVNFGNMRSRSKVTLALFMSPSQALDTLYNFQIFCARVMDGSVTPTKGPGLYPPAVLILRLIFYIFWWLWSWRSDIVSTNSVH